MSEFSSGEVGGPRRELGDGVAIPMLGLGVWQIPAGRATEQAVGWALEAGYRHIDTATIYRNERSVGAALRTSGIPREAVFVTTKWMPVQRGPRAELARSLERLGLDYVDLYLIHWPLPGRVSRAWREFELLRERGLARAIGVSNFGAKRLSDLLAAGGARMAVNQVRFSPLHFPAALLDYCTAQGIVLEAYSPLARGHAFAHPLIEGIAERLGRTTAQVMLRWALQHEAVVIPKSSREERIRENARIFDFELGADDMRALDALGVRASASAR